MKKLLILSVLFSTIFLACEKEPDPEPEVIRAFCYLYHFIPGIENIIWEVDGVEVPDAQIYSDALAGAVILESESEEISFAVRHAVSREVLISELFILEKDAFYNIVVGGEVGNPVLIIEEVDTKDHPGSGIVKFQVLHALAGENSVDVYIGGTTPDKQMVSDLDFFQMSDPFETPDYDARSAIVVSKHSDVYNQDSVLISSIYNDVIVSGASYLSVIAPYTHEAESDLHVWLYSLPLDF